MVDTPALNIINKYITEKLSQELKTDLLPKKIIVSACCKWWEYSDSDW